MYKKYQQGGNLNLTGSGVMAGESPYLRDLIAKLQGLGADMEMGENPFNFFQSMTPETVMNMIRNKYNISSKIDMSPDMFSGFTETDLQALQTDFYDPLRAETLESSQDKLNLAMQNIKSTGFAGSGRKITQEDAIKDIYNKQVSAGEEKIEAQQSAQAAALMDKINQWTKTGIDLRYG